MPTNKDKHYVELNIWTVYGTNTKDYPGMYVARLFKGDKPTDNFYVHADLDIIRDWILEEAKSLGNDYHLYRMERAPTDDPVIIETWL